MEFLKLLSALIKSTGVIVYAFLLVLIFRNERSSSVDLRYLYFYIIGLLLWELGSFIIVITGSYSLASICYRIVGGFSSLPVVFLYPLVKELLALRNKGKLLEIIGFGLILGGFIISLFGVGVRDYEIGFAGYYIPVFNRSIYIFSMIGFVYWGFSVSWVLKEFSKTYSELLRYKIRFILFSSTLVFIGEMSNLTPLRNAPVDHFLIMINGIIIVFCFLKTSILDYKQVFRKIVMYIAIYMGGLFFLHVFFNLFSGINPQNFLILKSFAIFFGLATFILLTITIKYSLFKIETGIFSIKKLKKYRTIIKTFSSMITNVADLDSFVSMLLDATKKALDLQKCLIFLKNSEYRGYEEKTGEIGDYGKPLVIVYEASIVNELKIRRDILFPNVLFSKKVLSRGEHILAAKRCIEAFVPLIYNSELLGFLCLGRKIDGNVITDEELDLCSLLASISSPALSNILRTIEFHQLSREQKLLRYISEIIISSSDFRHVMDSICSLLFDFMKLDYCAVVIVDEDEEIKYWSRGIPSFLMKNFKDYFSEKISKYSEEKSATNFIELPEENYSSMTGIDDIENLLKSSYVIVLFRDKTLIGLLILSGNLRINDIARKIDFLRMIRSIITQGILLHRSLRSLKRFNQYRENLLKTLDSMGELIISFNDDGIISNVNDSVSKVLGYKREELIGAKIQDLLAEKSERLWNEITSALFYGIPSSNMELIFTTRSGHKKYLLLSFSTLNQGLTGTCVYMAAGRDITYIKEKEKIIENSENKYRTIFEELHEGIFVCNERDEIVDINPAGIDVLGYTRREELMYQPFRTFFADSETAEKFFNELRRYGGVRNYEARLKKSGGDVIEVVLSARMDFNELGQKIGFRGLLSDVTDVRYLEKKLSEVKKLESLGSLARVMVGEFTNLLTTILGFSSLIKLSTEGDQIINEYVSTIQSSARMASKLVSQLLAFSRSLTLLRKPVDFNSIIDEVINQVKQNYPEVSIEKDITANLPLIDGDKSQLKLVLKNLCDNAIEAMNGMGKLRIKTCCITINSNSSFAGNEREMLKGEFIKCTISDSGRGIESKILERIFEPFYTTKKGVRGAGLGLSIVYGITREHGGFLDIKSFPGKGTDVELYFPVKKSTGFHLQYQNRKGVYKK